MRIASKAGWAEPIPKMDEDDPHWRTEYQATVRTWLLYLPGQALWSYYVLASVHLREIEGGEPAHKLFEMATHEIMMVALGPAQCDGLTAETYREKRPEWLSPLNYKAQVAAESDEEMEKLTDLTAKAFVSGMFPAEPQGIAIQTSRGRVTAKTYFRRTLERTLEHMRHDGHPFD